MGYLYGEISRLYFFMDMGGSIGSTESIALSVGSIGSTFAPSAFALPTNLMALIEIYEAR